MNAANNRDFEQDIDRIVLKAMTDECIDIDPEHPAVNEEQITLDFVDVRGVIASIELALTTDENDPFCLSADIEEKLSKEHITIGEIFQIICADVRKLARRKKST